MEVLNEIIPCGIDPVGVFILETKEERERGEKDLREVHRLLGALPVGTVINLTRGDQVIDEVFTNFVDFLWQVFDLTIAWRNFVSA